MFAFIKLSVLLSSLSVVAVISLQCVDENNNPVDWFIAYKIPEIKHNPHELINQGLSYVFITSEDYNHWSLSNVSINDSQSLIALTLSTLYPSKNDSFVIYNDQPPNEESKPHKGHNKGVVSFDSEGGFWLVHSVPHFPPLTAYSFPKTGQIYGQSFLCLSLDLENMNQVGLQMKYNEPQIYSVELKNFDKISKIRDLIEASHNVTINEAPWFREAILKTRKGVSFKSFAKSGRFLKDLYEDWLAPALQSDLLVETWSNGAGKLPSNCSKNYKVYNIDTLSIRTATANFSRSRDHSKWAVSRTSQSNWICIGDINRMEHQLFRGGGTVCLDNKIIANNYRKSILSFENCHKYKH